MFNKQKYFARKGDNYMKMSLVMDAVRRDAFEKVRNCKKYSKDEAMLFKTVCQIIELANIARDEGLLFLEEKYMK